MLNLIKHVGIIRRLQTDKCVNRICKFHIDTIYRSNNFNKQTARQLKSNKSTLYYATAAGVLVVGLSYAAVPLYRIFCQAYSYGGAMSTGHITSQVESMSANKHRPITIKFNADTASSMRWNFKPQQREITVVPGETALAFYTAINPTDTAVTGISTYNVVPFEAGQYFNKIQCFCFEEQRLNPKEQVDMPVYFYINPEFNEDPKMEYVDEITLSYTFFEAKEGLQLHVPSFLKCNLKKLLISNLKRRDSNWSKKNKILVRSQIWNGAELE